MIAPLLESLERFFGWVVTASWQASVLAVFVLFVQRMAGSRLNPRWRYALWLLVLLRLVSPALPESALSLFQFAPAPPAALENSVTQSLFVAPAPLAASHVAIEIAPSRPFTLYSLLAIVWLAGTIALFALTWIVNRRFARQVAGAPVISDPALLDLFAEAKAELAIRRTIRLVESGQVQSPAIMGLFQPTLLLPVDVRRKFDPGELRLIFLHELAHLKRGDIIVQGLIALLQILHWFNPVLWLAFRRMRADREPATDALVLSRAGEAEKERYGLMLIKLLEHFNQRHSLPTLVGILEDKDQFKHRFSLIARFTRGAYGWSLLGVLLIGVLSVVGLTKSKAGGPVLLTSQPSTTESKDKSPAEMIKISVKVVELNEDDYQAHQTEIESVVQKGNCEPLLHFNSSNLLFERAVFTKVGEQCVVESIRVLPYATAFEKDASGKISPTDFRRQNLGIRFVSLPSLMDDKINLKGDLDIASLESWSPVGEDSYKPIFHSREASVSDLFASGQTQGFQVPGGAQMEPLDPTIIFNPGKPPDASWNPKTLRRLFFFLTASAFSAGGSPIAATSTESTSPSTEKLRAGTTTDYETDETTDAKSSGEEPFTVRTFLIPDSFLGTKSSNSADVKRKLIEYGIEFPRDATITYLPMQNKLIARNTPEQLDKIAALIEALSNASVKPATDSSTPLPSKPSVDFHIVQVEVDETTYQQNAQAMDEAVRTGDLQFFANRSDGEDAVQTDRSLLNVGQPGWYSEGEVQSYVASVSREKTDGKFHTVLKANSVFYGLNADFTWSQNRVTLNSNWSVTEPVGFDKLVVDADIPPEDVPKDFRVPRANFASFTDKNWDMAPGKVHGFWVGKTLGSLKFWRQIAAGVKGFSIDEILNSESPTRLAIFMTAKPVAMVKPAPPAKEVLSPQAVPTPVSAVSSTGTSDGGDSEDITTLKKDLLTAKEDADARGLCSTASRTFRMTSSSALSRALAEPTAASWPFKRKCKKEMEAMPMRQRN